MATIISVTIIVIIAIVIEEVKKLTGYQGHSQDLNSHSSDSPR